MLTFIVNNLYLVNGVLAVVLCFLAMRGQEEFDHRLALGALFNLICYYGHNIH